MSESDTPHHCDLVMKGGITSGIVYPRALGELSKKYTFRQIGGTSAGAIAAACAAAAQYGDGTGIGGSGFDGLDAMSEQLGKGTHLLDLFQPSPQARPLFKTFLALSGKTAADKDSGYVAMVLKTIARLTVALLRYDIAGFLIGAGTGAAVAVLLRWLTVTGTGVWRLVPPGGWPMVWALLGAVVCGWIGGLIAGVIGLVRIVTEKIPKNFFGMCPGHAAKPDPNATPALTDWLHDQLQALAGLSPSDPPLTFGRLKQKEVKLNMVSTNLSQGQPVDLPLQGGDWIFNENDMRRLFPEPVVGYLIEKSKSNRADLPAGFHRLPAADDLPVVLAMRMSLSFPVLICAVPLYSKGAGGANDLVQNWFSDGGISSNFPIHFFDAWLPKCPTFGINLRSMPKDRSRDHAKARAAVAGAEPGAEVHTAMDGQVFLPGACGKDVPEFQPIAKITEFLGAIWNTAQNYHDNTQAALPSYRERIVNVRFESDEGGLNLTMDAAKVADVQAKGARAGAMLRDDFDWPTHKWVRFQVLMPQLELQLKDMKDTLESSQYTKLLDEVAGACHPRDKEWRADATRRVHSLLEMIGQWRQFDDEFLRTHREYDKQCFFPFGCPQPTPVLRVSPKL